MTSLAAGTLSDPIFSWEGQEGISGGYGLGETGNEALRLDNKLGFQNRAGVPGLRDSASGSLRPP